MTRDRILRWADEIAEDKLDARAKKTFLRLLIELTCGAETKLRSRYANALGYAKIHKCPPEKLTVFIKGHGGIESCARKYIVWRKTRDSAVSE